MEKGLLRQRRFAPFFWTQALGAYNDNVFKNALAALILFRITDEAQSGLINTIAAGLFILPFMIFSPLAGQIGEKYPKDKVFRVIKFAEILIMALGFVGFWLNSISFLILILFLMGSQSAFFGPVKYSIMPQTLKETELMKGTGYVEMGTFLGVLIGMIVGVALLKNGDGGGDTIAIGVMIIGTAIAGYLTARLIPYVQPEDPHAKIELNPMPEVRRQLKLMLQKDTIFNSILGISWFWFIGAGLVSILPALSKYAIGGDKDLYMLLIGVFTVAMAIGSVLCDKIASSHIEIGLVPLGAIMISAFSLDLGLLTYPVVDPMHPLSPSRFFAETNSIRILFDLFCLGIGGSLFIVPLYALIQHRSPKEDCSRIIAGNNILNAVFMVLASVVIACLYAIGMPSHRQLIVLAILNFAVSIYIFLKVQEFVLRCLIWVLAKTIYSLHYEGRENIPAVGPAVVVANHVSFIDWFIISAACQRPVHFVMYHKIFQIPVLNWIFKMGKCIPIAPEKENPEIKRHAFEKISQVLKNNDLICLFPEGQITKDGSLCPFRPGIEKIIQHDPVPVIPISISGVWGSFFSRKAGRAMSTVPQPKRRRIDVKIGKAIPPAQATAEDLQNLIAAMQTAK